jgi:hypothetical protein
LTDDDPRGMIGSVRDGQEYLLVRRDIYEKMQMVLKPFSRGWDDPRLDDYEIYRKKKA